MHDLVLHDLFDAFRESITHGRKINLSIEEDHAPILLWRCVCSRYHKMKVLEVKKKLLQHCEERVLQLSNELKVDDEVVLEVLPHFVSHNFSILDEHDIQSREKIRKYPTGEEIDAKNDPNL